MARASASSASSSSPAAFNSLAAWSSYLYANFKSSSLPSIVLSSSSNAKAALLLPNAEDIKSEKVRWPATMFYAVAPCLALLPLLRDGQE
jgi:hypothetical protein